VGCSFKKLAYEHADWLILRKIDSYFDINTKQKEFLKPVIQTHLKFVNDKLPKLVEILQIAHRKLEQNLTKDDIAFAFDTYSDLRTILMKQIAMSIGEFSTMLSSEQHKYFLEALMESNEEHEERLTLPEGKMQAKYAEKLMDKTEEWVGSFSTEQEKKFIHIFSLSKQEMALRLEIRKAFQTAIADLLAAKSSPVEKAQILEKWTVTPQLMLPKNLVNSYLEQGKSNRSRWYEASQLLTSEQRAHMRKKIKELIDDLEKMHKSRAA
jgi:hypothetical protein